jgi:hypothetical protein
MEHTPLSILDEAQVRDKDVHKSQEVRHINTLLLL